MFTLHSSTSMAHVAPVQNAEQSHTPSGAAPTHVPPFKHGALPLQSLGTQLAPWSEVVNPGWQLHVGMPPSFSKQI